jgi:hypothetical protein
MYRGRSRSQSAARNGIRSICGSQSGLPFKKGYDIALDLGLSANITEPFPAGVLRFALPLTSSEEEIDFGLSVLDESITRVVETAGN